MIELIKKSFLASLGAAAVSKEAVENQLNQWVEQGKITSQEAQNMAMTIIEQGKNEFENARGEFSKLFNEMLAKANVATRNEIEALEKRLEELEKKQPADKSSAKA